MPSYKLVYFNGRGLAEMCRLLFAEANQKYEDFRINSTAQWAEVKGQMPFNKVPVLFVDGAYIANSRAAFRFLAREFGMTGSCNIQQGKIDVWLETLTESFQDFPHLESDEVKKAEKVKEVMEKNVNPKLSLLNEEIKTTKGPYMFSEFSAGDVAIYALAEFLNDKFGITFEDFPELDTLQKTVAQRPNIKAWLDTRPPEQRT